MSDYSYGFDNFLVHFAFAIALFFIINWIGKKSYSLGYIQLSVVLKADEAPAFNFLLRVLTPIIYILLISTLLYTLKVDKYVKYIYLVNIYYIVFRVSVNILLGRTRLMNWKQQINLFFWISLLSYITYSKIIVIKKNILPDFGSISNELWFIIILFLYALFNKIQFPLTETVNRKRNYIRNRYKYFSKKYGAIISDKAKNKNLEPLIYAILIQESFNRPKLCRLAENLLFEIGKAKTLGVMQIKTDKYINDEDSIKLGVEKIHDAYNTFLKEIQTEKEQKEWNIESYLERRVILDYNPDINYYIGVSEILQIIRSEFYNI